MSSTAQVDIGAYGAVAKRDNSRMETCYKPLDVSRNEIRILVYRVIPYDGPVPVKIECIFKVVSLEDRPVFDALSYTWGHPYAQSTWNPKDRFVHLSEHPV